MLLATSVLCIVAAAAPDSSESVGETWVSAGQRGARLVAQAEFAPPPMGAPLTPQAHLDLGYRTQRLTTERFALERQLYRRDAAAAFTAAGSVFIGVGAIVGSFGMHMLYNLGTTFASVTAFVGGITGLVCGVVMLVLSRVIAGQVDRHNRNIDERLSAVEIELEAIEAARQAPPGPEGGQPPPMNPQPYPTL